MREWFDFPMEVDEDCLAERWDGVVVLDESLRALARENRLSLWRSDPERVDQGDGTAALLLELRCVAHAHPDCRFRWVRLNVDFSAMSGVQITDMSPRDDVSTTPVELTTTRSGMLGFKINAVPLTADTARNRVAERNVYLPRLTTSGRRMQRGTWDFSAVAESPLHVDRDLRILLSMPSAARSVPATVTLRGLVAAGGVAGTIPLVGRRSGAFVAYDDLG